MAIRYECDRCGSQTSDKDDIGPVGYPILNGIHQLSGDGAKKDLCISCIRELHEFLKPLPKLAK